MSGRPCNAFARNPFSLGAPGVDLVDMSEVSDASYVEAIERYTRRGPPRTAGPCQPTDPLRG